MDEMKHIKLFEAFLKPGVKFLKYELMPRGDRTEADILQGFIDRDTYITYVFYTENSKYAGEESMELYRGANYVPGSKKSSYSRYWYANKIPSIYKDHWESLKSLYGAYRKHSMTPEVFQMWLDDGCQEPVKKWLHAKRGALRGREFGF